MGGVLIIISIVIPTLLWANLRNPYVWIALAALVGFGWIGFLDDYAKITQRRNLGLTGKRKLIYQFSLGFAFAAGLLVHARIRALLHQHECPVLQAIHAVMADRFAACATPGPMCLAWRRSHIRRADCGLHLKRRQSHRWPGWPGHRPDGHLGRRADHAGVRRRPLQLADYLQLSRNPRTSELTIFCGSMTGASLGFLWYNAHPAEIFMGDVGSLGLGGAMAVVAVLIKQEVLLVFIGGIFILEAVSVILQVGSYKLRHGKRIFKMAPLHHHFEALGWTESKIIARFWIAGLVLALFALTTLKLR